MHPIMLLKFSKIFLEACGVVEGAKQSVLSVKGVMVGLYFYLETEHTGS